MRHILFALLMLLTTITFAQKGYRIDFKVKGWKDTTAYLGFYQGESSYVKDTAIVNPKGEFFFDGKKELPEGVYFLVIRNKQQNMRLIDFVVGKDQHFTLETASDDLIKSMKVTGDEDNKIFFENQLFIAARHEEAEPFIKILQDTSVKDDSKKTDARTSFARVNAHVLEYQGKVIKEHPTLMTSKILNATRNIEVPPAPKRADGSIDSTFQLKYYRQHFFDNFDLSDEALLRLPKGIYQEKIKEYLSKLFLPQSDSISAAIDFIVSKAKKNPETYKYLVYTCAVLYQAPDIMGLDQVFVNLNKKYFASGEMDYWANAPMKKNFQEHADKISLAQIGTTAPDLVMQDQNLQLRRMYDIKKKYTIVYFFDPDCSHCRQETPKLVSYYANNKDKHDFEVFAVSSDTSIKKLKEYIKEMKMTWITVCGPRSTHPQHYTKLYFAETFPTVYILDEKKKVIARKLPVEKIDEFFTNYERAQRLRAKGKS